jgi:diacylglycerol kinase family enzyme
MFAAPEADLTDGLLDVLIIGDISKPDLLWSLPRLYKGTHLTHPKVTIKRGKEIEIHSKESIFLQADGELLGKLPARFYLLPAALNVIV